MKNRNNTPDYRNYLNLDTLLNAQKLISEKRGKKAHDEGNHEMSEIILNKALAILKG